MSDLVVALGLMLALEGILYAAFPKAVRESVARLLSMPDSRVRAFGLTVAVAGVAVVWLVRG